MRQLQLGNKYRLSDKTIDRLLNLALATSLLMLLVSFTHTPVTKKTDKPPVAQYTLPLLPVSPATERQPFAELATVEDSAIQATAQSAMAGPTPAVADPHVSPAPAAQPKPDQRTPSPLRSLTNVVSRILSSPLGTVN